MSLWAGINKRLNQVQIIWTDLKRLFINDSLIWLMIFNLLFVYHQLISESTLTSESTQSWQCRMRSPSAECLHSGRSFLISSAQRRNISSPLWLPPECFRKSIDPSEFLISESCLLCGVTQASWESVSGNRKLRTHTTNAPSVVKKRWSTFF